MLEQLQSDLPNFPPEILSEWLLPFAKSIGWPPSTNYNAIPLGRWEALLIGKPLSFWRRLSWKKVDRHISLHNLHKKSHEAINEIVLGAVAGQINLCSILIPDLKVRFDKVIDYLSVHGIFPKPPSLIKCKNGLRIVDGNHRIAAYLYAYGYCQCDIIPQLKTSTKEIQSYWMA